MADALYAEIPPLMLTISLKEKHFLMVAITWIMAHPCVNRVI
jgi:hypothetical protein